MDTRGASNVAKRKDNTARNAAIAGAGGATAATALAAGGIPGARSDFTSVLNPKPGQGKTRVGRAVNTAVSNRNMARAAPGGILGFRVHAHEGGTAGFKEQAAKIGSRKVGPDKAAQHGFSHGYTEGKIAPEEKIIRHMKGGRKAAAGALLAGGGAVAYGTKKNKVHKAQRDTDKYHGALAGTGGAGLALTAGGTKMFRSQERKWRNVANTNVDEAQKLVPRLGGRRNNQDLRQYKRHLRRGGTPENFPKTMTPERSLTDIMRDKNAFKGVSPEKAKKAGQLRGAAAQAEHFSHVYGNTGKVVGRLRTPSAIVAGAGVGGLAASGKKDKVKKSMSAFGVDHEEVSKRRPMSDNELATRKKVQGHISRTTSTLGLGGLGLLAASAVARKNPARLKQIQSMHPRLKNVQPEKIKNTAQNVALVSGGIGGLGGYNFASYTAAEAKKKQRLKKSDETSPFADGYYGSEGKPLSREVIESAFAD